MKAVKIPRYRVPERSLPVLGAEIPRYRVPAWRLPVPLAKRARQCIPPPIPTVLAPQKSNELTKP
jgi:hypothetical protein